MIPVDQVFSIRQYEWIVVLDGVVLKTTWNSKGAALAGLEVERRRKLKKLGINTSRVVRPPVYSK